MGSAHSVFTASLRDFPSAQVNIGVDCHNVSGRTLYNHLHSVGEVANGAIHIRLAVFHTTKHACGSANFHHALIAAAPSEGGRIHGTLHAIDGVFHSHGILAIGVGNDGVVHNAQSFTIAQNLNRHGGSEVAISGSKHSIAAAIATESACVGHVSYRFGTSDRHTL